MEERTAKRRKEYLKGKNMFSFQITTLCNRINGKRKWKKKLENLNILLKNTTATRHLNNCVVIRYTNLNEKKVLQKEGVNA